MEMHTEEQAEAKKAERPRFGWRQMTAALAAEFGKENQDEAWEVFLERSSLQSIQEAAHEAFNMLFGRLTKAPKPRPARDPDEQKAEDEAVDAAIQRVAIARMILDNGKMVKESTKEEIAVAARKEVLVGMALSRIAARLQPGQVAGDEMSDEEMEALK